MRRRIIDALTALTVFIWINAVGALVLPQFAEASRPNEYCSSTYATCPAAANGCAGCVFFGTGGCTSYSLFSCGNSGAKCSGIGGCSCNPNSC